MFANNQVSILVIVQSHYALNLVAILRRELVQLISVHNRIALDLVDILFVV